MIISSNSLNISNSCVKFLTVTFFILLHDLDCKIIFISSFLVNECSIIPIVMIGSDPGFGNDLFSGIKVSISKNRILIGNLWNLTSV